MLYEAVIVIVMIIKRLSSKKTLIDEECDEILSHFMKFALDGSERIFIRIFHFLNMNFTPSYISRVFIRGMI